MADEGPFTRETVTGLRGFDPERASGESVVDLTAMIDVTILLLIFFMVTATLAARDRVDLPLARHGRGLDPEVTTSIVVFERTDEAGPPAVLVEPDADPGATLDEVRLAVEEGLADNRTRVVVKAHRHARWGDVSKVARAAAEVEGVGLYVGVREKE